MKWRWNRCRRREASLSLFAAGALTGQEADELQAHLRTCQACRTRLAELRTVAAGLAAFSRRMPELDAPASLRRRWLSAIRESGQPAPKPAAPSWIDRPGGRRVAWGSLAAAWMLTLFFRFSAPEPPARAHVPTATPPLREVLIFLQTARHELPFEAAAAPLPDARPAERESPKPRSQGAVSPAANEPGGRSHA